MCRCSTPPAGWPVASRSTAQATDPLLSRGPCNALDLRSRNQGLPGAAKSRRPTGIPAQTVRAYAQKCVSRRRECIDVQTCKRPATLAFC
jgi:hypothetical protein